MMLKPFRNGDLRKPQILSSRAETQHINPRKPGKISGWDPDMAMTRSVLGLHERLNGKEGAIESDVSLDQGILSIRASKSARFMTAAEPELYKPNGPELSPDYMEDENEISKSSIERAGHALGESRSKIALTSFAVSMLLISASCGLQVYALSTQSGSKSYYTLGVLGLHAIGTSALLIALLAMLSRRPSQDTLFEYHVARNISIHVPRHIMATIKHTIISVLPEYPKTTKMTASWVLRIVGWSEPPLENGKSRVRWQCVSLRTFKPSLRTTLIVFCSGAVAECTTISLSGVLEQPEISRNC